MAELCKDLIPSILTTKKYCLEDEKDYVPFIVNRALSYHDDALFYANQLNQMSGLDRRLQYDFLINSIRGKKRYFTKWAKVRSEEHTSELQSLRHLVCRLLLEKKKNKK